MTTQQEFENYFKGQINWKEFNYILDIITKYQDKGIDISLSAVVHIKDKGRYDDVYLVDSNGFNYHNYSHNFKYRSNVYDEIVENSKTNEAKYRQRLKKNPAPKVGRPRMMWVRWSDLPYKNKLTV